MQLYIPRHSSRAFYKFLLIGFALFSTNLTPSAFGQKIDTSACPKIGLALSGGGAKGLAHIGVLKVLEQEGIKVDMISGTSMGSIVGGLYAIGYSAAEIEKIMHGMNWDELLADNISRQSISIEEKEEDGRYVAEFKVKKGKVQLPKGMINGQKMMSSLSHLTWSAHAISDYNKLPIPFCAVATDIVTGKAYTIRHGFLPEAIRASMAIPTALTPIEIDGHLLVDGMLCRNFPVSDVKDMGATIIIGSDVGAPLYKKEQIVSMVQVLDQASSFNGAASTIEQQKLCDVLITHDLRNYTSSSFSDADSLVKIGEASARKMLPELKKIARLQNKQKKTEQAAAHPMELHSFYIDHITIEGLEKVSHNVVLSNLQIKEHSWVGLKDIESGIGRIYGSRYFESVTYKVNYENDHFILVIKVKEQELSRFKFAINYDSDLKASVLLNYTMRNLLGEGSKISLDVKLGEYPMVKASYSFFTRWKPAIGFKTTIMGNTLEAFSYDSKGILAGDYRYRHLYHDIIAQAPLSNSFALSIGIRNEYGDGNSRIVKTDTTVLGIGFYSTFLHAVYDNLDRAVYPTEGKLFDFSLRWIVNSYSSKLFTLKETYPIALLKYSAYVPITPSSTLSFGLHAGSVFAGIPHVSHYFFLGGNGNPYESNLIPFYGREFMQEVSKNFAIAQLGLQFEPWKGKFILLKSNIGQVGNDLRSLTSTDGILAGFGIGGGYSTIIGPVDLIFSFGNKTQGVKMNFSLGFRF